MGKKKTNAAKKRADQRRRARTEAREHIRESQKANQLNTATKFGQALQGFNERLKKITEEQRAKVTEIGEDSDSSPVVGHLPKPDWQGQNEAEGVIYWRWDIVNDQASVTAHYYTANSEISFPTLELEPIRHRAGDYIVTVRMVDNAETFTAAEAKRFGEALISAHAWEHVWRNFSGEYIANGGWSDEAVQASKEYEDERDRIELEQEIVAKMTREKPQVRIEHLHIHPEDGMIGTSPNCPGGVDLPEPKAESNEEVSEDDYENFEPFVHSCCEHCEIDKDIHAPHTEGCPND